VSISTKTGDGGETSLWTGQRVAKDDLRVEAYGTIDELNSQLGLARRAVGNDRTAEMLDEIQEDLFRVAGALACAGGVSYGQPILQADVDRLTGWVHELEAALPLSGFVIPGAVEASARLDVCRTVCRRAERRIVSLARAEEVDGAALGFVNRLSDLLFMLARMEEAEHGGIRYKRGKGAT